MKVICIEDVFMGKKLQITAGEIYTASQCFVYPNNYDIKEYPINKETGQLVSYRKNLFAPLSSIDEIEFERNYNKELI